MGTDLNPSKQSELFTCTMCGHRFDPAEQTACKGCPVQRGCQLVCCPACGFETVDPSRSRLARLAGFFLSKGKQSAPDQEPQSESR